MTYLSHKGYTPMNKKFLSILLLCTAALVTGLVHAEGIKGDAPAKDAAKVATKAPEAPKHTLKAGVVSATDIMMGTEIGQSANKRIDTKRMDMMTKLQKEADDVKKLEDTFKAKMSTMSEASKRDEAVKIESRKQEIELKNKQFMQELQVAAQKEMEDLGVQFDEAVRKTAKELNLDILFEKESGRIVFASEAVNVTESVKVAMNAQHKTTQVASAAKAPAKATA
jgi:Skp family chaperone for outer membrane proteins